MSCRLITATLFLLCSATSPLTSAPFGIIAIPDTQYYSSESLDFFEEQTTWACNNRDYLGIDFVTHEGDIVNDYNTRPYEWLSAARAISILDDCSMPYSLLPGNHDTDLADGYLYYDQTFPPKDNNTYPPGTNRNSFHLIPDKKLLFLSIEWLYGDALTYRTELLAWADHVLSNHSDWTAFITSHYVASDCANSPDPYIAILMTNHCNVAMAFGGHTFMCEGQRNAQITNSCGKTRWLLTADFQARPHGGDGWLRFYQFDGVGTMCAYTYSTKFNEYEMDPLSWFQLQNDYQTLEVGCLRVIPYPLSGYVSPFFIEVLVIMTTGVLATFILIWSSLV